jgi:Tfp pilus assembly protein FimT
MFKAKNSFTLIEMLVVLGIMVLIAGLSLPFFSGFAKGARLKQAAKEVSSVFRTARNLAVTQHQEHSVQFVIDDETVQYYISEANDTLVEKKHTLPAGVTICRPSQPSESITFENNKVTFKTTGSIDGSGGALWLSDSQGKFKRISILPASGRVMVDEEP